MGGIAYASQIGLDCIVTDHHEPPSRLPEATSVINPKQPGCPYPFKGLAGAGVALKVAQALLEEIPADLLELAAIRVPVLILFPWWMKTGG